MSGPVALVFGAFIIVFFAYDRFNRAGYEGSQQFERLVPYLSPDKLRARQVVLRAYLFYAATLLMIYFFLCIYAEVLPQFGASLSDAETAVGATVIGASESSAAASGEGGQLISPSIALGVALIMVGMAPSFPILERFEHWLRTTAQRLAGIPTRVIEIAEGLRRNNLWFEGWDWTQVPSPALLIPAGDWQRMVDYDRAARGSLSAPDEFRDNLEIIFAVSAWILEGKLKLSGIRDRLRFRQLEQALLDRFKVLVATLDEKAAASPAAPAPLAKRDGSWDRLAHEVDNLADDFCFLLALYLEHGIIDGEAAMPAPDGLAEAPQAGGGAGQFSSHHQQQLAQAKLNEFLAVGCNKLLSPAPRSYMLAAWLWTIFVVVAVSLAWSVFPGSLEAEMQGGIRLGVLQRAVGYTIFGFGTFCVPMLVVLALRDGGLQTHHWVNMSSVHWTRALPQAVGVLLISSIAATLMLLAASMWELLMTRGSFDLSTAKSSLRFQLFYGGPATLKGAILALIVARLLDDSDARVQAPPRSRTWPASLRWAMFAALAMALWGGVTRTMTSLAAMTYFGRESLDAIDRGLIFYATVHSTIIGFLVVFCVAEYVFNQNLLSGGAQQVVRRRLPGPPLAGE